MQKRMFVTLPICALTLLLMTTGAASAAQANKRVFTLGRITENAGKHHAPTKAMADYLASQLKDLGVEEARVILTGDVEQMMKYVKQGEVDLLNDTVFTTVRLLDEAGAELLLKADRKRAAFHSTVFVARKDSGINSLADLRGHIIAFENETSTAGYFIPAAELISQGYKLIHLNSPRQHVPADSIGYLFSSEEINSALMVHKKLAHAATFNNTDLSTEGSMPQEMRNDIKVFHETVSFPRSLMVVSKKLSPAVKERLKQVLLGTPSDPQSSKLLVGYHAITKFEPISKADLKGIEEGRRLGKVLRAKTP